MSTSSNHSYTITNEEEMFGQIVTTTTTSSSSSSTYQTSWEQEAATNQEGKLVEVDYDKSTYVPVLPFTEEQEHKRQALEEKYRDKPLEVQIDSIDPAGGPITGNTRVTVRGGPF